MQFTFIWYRRNLLAASICRYLCISYLTPQAEAQIEFHPPPSPDSCHPWSLRLIFFISLLPSCHPSIFHLFQFNIHQLSSAHSVISPLDWSSVCLSAIFTPYFTVYKYIRSPVSFYFSGEELWIGVIKSRPQEWPGGYPGDLGEATARRRSG